MNVTTMGVAPMPLPAPLAVQRPTSAQAAPDAGARQATEHGTRPEKSRRELERERERLPQLKPVTTDEFRVMLGALPASALSMGERGTGLAVDTYA